VYQLSKRLINQIFFRSRLYLRENEKNTTKSKEKGQRKFETYEQYI